ncbi:MAG: Hint domain-containing protein [Paracoccaceae bacterium]
MGYNISEVSGGSTGGVSDWFFEATLNGTSVTTVSGDFDEVPLFGGGGPSESDQGYDFVITSGDAYGDIVFDAVTGEFTFVIDRDAVFDSGSDQVITILVTGTDTQGVDEDTITITLLICVARGTLIETEHGSVPVEMLTEGALVRTRDGPSQPVRWIGSRRISGAELRGDPSLRPIRISAGALGPNRPSRDLLVSPQHRILVEDWRAELMFGETEVLVPAKALLNDTTVRIDHDAPQVEYFHVLFDSHQIMLTEGLPTESFHPGDYALREIDRGARDELLRLFPELATAHGVGDTARKALRPWEGALLRGCVSGDVTEDLRLAS